MAPPPPMARATNPQASLHEPAPPTRAPASPGPACIHRRAASSASPQPGLSPPRGPRPWKPPQASPLLGTHMPTAQLVHRAPWGSVAGWGEEPASGLGRWLGGDAQHGQVDGQDEQDSVSREHAEAAAGTPRDHTTSAGPRLIGKAPWGPGPGQTQGGRDSPPHPALRTKLQARDPRGSSAGEPFPCARLLLLLKTRESEPQRGAGDATSLKGAS